MSKSKLVDFKVVNAAVSMEQVLQHYGLLDGLKRSGDSLTGPCPIHKGTNKTQFRVSISKNCWNSFLNKPLLSAYLVIHPRWRMYPLDREQAAPELKPKNGGITWAGLCKATARSP
jgi:hypothetical protein